MMPFVQVQDIDTPIHVTSLTARVVACPITLEPRVIGGRRVQGQPGLHNKKLSKMEWRREIKPRDGEKKFLMFVTGVREMPGREHEGMFQNDGQILYSGGL